MARLGRVPKVGDRVTIGNLSIEVETMKGKRIESLILRLISQPAPAAARTPQSPPEEPPGKPPEAAAT